MKKVLILIFLALLIDIKSYSQNTVTFTYDVNGNRETVSRNFTLSSSNQFKNGKNKENIEDEVYNDNIDKHNILIYPNPVKEKVTIKIEDLKQEDKSLLTLYDANGKVLKEIKVVDNKSSINMEKITAGVYFLVISVNGKKERWKIIKE